MKACSCEALESVRRLIAQGSDVNKADGEGFSPLMCACVEGRADVVPLLLARGADVNRSDLLGRTPLSFTVTRGDFSETADALISAGADLNRTDNDGFMPLMRAALMSHVRCFEILLRKGADTAPVNSYWRKTALDMAAERGSEDMRRLAERVRSGEWPA